MNVGESRRTMFSKRFNRPPINKHNPISPTIRFPEGE